MTILVAALALLSTAPPPAEAPAAAALVVAFDLLPTKHMVLAARINGKGPYRFLFDTGAPVNVVTNRVARDTGMVDKDAKPPLFALFGSVGPVMMRTLELGRLKAENTPAVVMDHPTIEVMSEVFGRIDGILGYPFFARYRMTLDYQAKRMTFVPNGHRPPDVLESLLATVMALADDRPQPPRVLAPSGLWGMVVHKTAGDEEPGVTVSEVFPDGAAAKAGMKAGDRLLTVGGRWTDSVADAYAAAGYARPGGSVVLVLRRAGTERTWTLWPRNGF